jgi:hypothetical protein
MRINRLPLKPVLSVAGVLLLALSWELTSPRPVPETPLPTGRHWPAPEECRDCHSQAYWSWRNSAHRNAYRTLEAVGRQRDPACLPCHVTGFGTWEGFIDVEHTPELQGVTCGVCHSPADHHLRDLSFYRPSRHVPPERCNDCHTADERCPGIENPAAFTSRFAEKYAAVHDSDRPHYHSSTMAEAVRAQVARGENILVEVFMAPACPSTRDFVRELVEFAQIHPNLILRFHIIAYETGNRAKEDFFRSPPDRGEVAYPGTCFIDGEFSGLAFQTYGGEKGVQEGILYALIQNFLPFSYLDFLQCYLEQPAGGLPLECLEKVGLYPDRFMAVRQEQGEAHLAYNIQEAWNRRARLSPTVYISGERWPHEPHALSIIQAACHAFDQAQCQEYDFKCRLDIDCLRYGADRYCDGAGTGSGTCVGLTTTSPTILLIEAAGVPRPDLLPVLRGIIRQGVWPLVESLDSKDPRAVELLDLLPPQERRLPAFFIEHHSGLETQPFLERSADRLRRYGAWWFYALPERLRPWFPERPERRRHLDLFLDPDQFETQQFLLVAEPFLRRHPEIAVQRHSVTPGAGLAGKLGLSAPPAVLINNRYLWQGSGNPTEFIAVYRALSSVDPRLRSRLLWFP